jgi:hypothetical protein
MRTLLLVAAAALGLAACSYPDTKMVPVEPTDSQMQPANDATSTTPPASGKSAAAKR